MNFSLLACTACPIYLTIGLNGKTVQESNLELNWSPDCYTRPEWIGFYSDNPTISFTQPLLRIENVTNATFKMSIKQKLSKLRFPTGWNRNDFNTRAIEYSKGKCLNYYAASFNGNELLAVECLKIYPNWLTKLANIRQLPLKDLFIPGTHASGAYIIDYVTTKSFFTKDYAATQYFDVWSQLVFGIRYLDLSIGYKAQDNGDSQNPDHFWIVNENMFINQLRYIFKDIRRFVNISGEVVIIDFSSFPIGFYKHPERHRELLYMLKDELGSLAYERNTSSERACFELTVEEIKKAGKSLVILYPLEELPHSEAASLILCPAWKRFSTDVMNNSQTLDYMRLLFSKKKSSPVQDEGWIFNAIKSLEKSVTSEKLLTSRERASRINPKVSNWLKGPWGSNANVVAIDYFSSTNLIDMAIYSNLQKAFTRTNRNLLNFEIVKK
uniref:Phosphatidylinositol-specific phospholipase C X domain-containing protein n=1 Tax=Glossina brevipalpis TaxID=37001 RepID=A0A1A9WD25_9MUSC